MGKPIHEPDDSKIRARAVELVRWSRLMKAQVARCDGASAGIDDVYVVAVIHRHSVGETQPIGDEGGDGVAALHPFFDGVSVRVPPLIA